MKLNARGERFGLFHRPDLVIISVDHQTSLTSSFGVFNDVLYASDFMCELSREYRLVGKRNRETGEREREEGR